MRLLYKDGYYSHCNNCFFTTTICIIDTVYKVLYVNGLRLSSYSIKRRCDDVNLLVSVMILML